MSLSQTEQQLLWSTANSVSVASGGNQTSDEIAHNNDAFQAKIQLKADNDGTPASGDIVDFYLLESLGDPDGASADEFAVAAQGRWLATLDTNANDPAEKVVWIPGPLYKSKLYAVNSSTGRAITVSATILEHRSS